MVERDGGDQRLTKMRGFVLALAYALGMAIVYTAFGVAAGLAGEGLAAALQRPWVLTLFAALLVALALSLFGLYELQLPSSWQTRVAQASGRTTGGKLGGVFAMGALSALIVGPCVAAPLAGALLYISQTRDVVIGGSALFAMATGMSVPLLLVGVSAGSLLPRAGPWMESIKRLFGVLLIAVALWTVSPVIPAWAQMLAWAALFIVSATYLCVFDALPKRCEWLAAPLERRRARAARSSARCRSSAPRVGGAMYCGRWNAWPRPPAPRRRDRWPGAASRASTSSMRRSRARAANLYCSTSMRIGASLARRWTASPSAIRASPPSWLACSCSGPT